MFILSIKECHIISKISYVKNACKNVKKSTSLTDGRTNPHHRKELLLEVKEKQ